MEWLRNVGYSTFLHRISFGGFPPCDTQTILFHNSLSSYTISQSWARRVQTFIKRNLHREIDYSLLKMIPNRNLQIQKNIGTELSKIVRRFDIKKIQDKYILLSLEKGENMPTYNSRASSTGNHAEVIFCDDTHIRKIFELYFDKKIIDVLRIKGNKKSDIQLIFSDGTKINIQNKNGTSGFYHIDRRKLDRYEEFGIEIAESLKSVCINHAKVDRTHIQMWKETVMDVVRSIIIGTDTSYQPDFFTHSVIHNNEIISLSIISREELLKIFKEEMYDQCDIRTSTIHISPYISFQRKGSEKGDSRPNDIQAKLNGKRLFVRYTKLL